MHQTIGRLIVVNLLKSLLFDPAKICNIWCVCTCPQALYALAHCVCIRQRSLACAIITDNNVA